MTVLQNICRYAFLVGMICILTFMGVCLMKNGSNAYKNGDFETTLTLIQAGERSRQTVQPTLPRFRIKDMGTLGRSTAYGEAINSQSQITGTSDKPHLSAGLIFLWENGKMQEIGTLPGKTSSTGSGINSSGHIVGDADSGSDGDGDRLAVIWRNGRLQGLFPDARWSRAIAINDRDEVVGTMKVGRNQHAFLWRNGQITDLGTLYGGNTSAKDINDMAQIVGSSDYDGGQRAFLWDRGIMRDLGTLGGKYSEAKGINDKRQVVGGAETNQNEQLNAFHAFLWEKGKMYDLGSPGPGLCYGNKINLKGQIVGEWWPEHKGFDGSHALLWEGRKLYDLNDLIPANSGWVLTDAKDINDQGQIVGTGKRNGTYHAFLLTFISPQSGKDNHSGH